MSGGARAAARTCYTPATNTPPTCLRAARTGRQGSDREGVHGRGSAGQAARPCLPAGRPGRPPKPERLLPGELCYATVCKTREKGRVVNVVRTVVFGTLALVTGMLASLQGNHHAINTSFVERRNGTDRGQNARKTRKSYRFSKDWDIHNAASYFICYSYNFCWPVRTLRVQQDDDSWMQRTPAMAAGLASHVWTLEEWLTYQAKPG